MLQESGRRPVHRSQVQDQDLLDVVTNADRAIIDGPQIGRLIIRQVPERIRVTADSARFVFSTPGAIRTRDPRFRKPVLYPLSYEGKLLLINDLRIDIFLPIAFRYPIRYPRP